MEFFITYPPNKRSHNNQGYSCADVLLHLRQQHAWLIVEQDCYA